MTAWHPVEDLATWESLLGDGYAPVQQSWAWGEAEARRGHKVTRMGGIGSSGPVRAQVSFRFGGRLAWCAGGPVGEASTDDIRRLAVALGRPVVAAPHAPLDRPGIRRAYMPATSIVPLDRSDAELRAQMHGKWRSSLAKAERTDDLEVGDCDIATVLRLQAAMEERKGFRAPYGEPFLTALAEAFGDGFTARAVHAGGDVLAVWVDLRSHTTALYLIGATSPRGRSSNASYLLAWDCLQRLRDAGTTYLDTGGFDPATPGGTTRFKQRLGGTDIAFPGLYIAGRHRVTGWALGIAARRSPRP